MRIILPLFSFVTLGFALLQLNSSKQDSSYDLDAMLYNPYLLVALLAVQSFLLIWRLKESNPAVEAVEKPSEPPFCGIIRHRKHQNE